MTAAQKTAKLKFKQAIAYRQKTGVTLKEAFAHIYGKKVGAVKKKIAPKKKAAKKVVRKVVKKKAAPKKKAAKKKIGYSKIRLEQEKGITKVLKNTPKTLFPYTSKEKIVKAGKKYFDDQAKKISGLYKIIGSVSGKYYIEYITEDGYKKMEFFNKFPKGYYKGMNRIIYVTRLTKDGTALIPVKFSDNNKDVKK